LDFQIELCRRYFGLFWLGHCLGYFEKLGENFQSFSQTQSKKIGLCLGALDFQILAFLARGLFGLLFEKFGNFFQSF
jgi:hypothetical protein